MITQELQLKSGRKYTHNSAFFSKPDIINSYWAGFIAADGHIMRKKNGVQIRLHKKDFSHLNKFKVAIQGTEPILQSSFDGSIILCIHDANFKYYLNKYYNIVPHKSLILLPPKIKNKEYIRAFIRGYFDGDGCLTLGGPDYRFILIGTLEVLAWIKERLKQYLEIGNPAIRKIDNYYKIEFGGNIQSKKIMDFLYKNSNDAIRLDRKYSRYIEYFYNE